MVTGAEVITQAYAPGPSNTTEVEFIKEMAKKDSLCTRSETTHDPLNWVHAEKDLQGLCFNSVRQMVDAYPSAQEVTLEGKNLTTAQVVAVACRPDNVAVKLEAAKAKARVDESSNWVLHQMNKGTNTYDITMGFGATSHRRTNEGTVLQKELIHSLNASAFGHDENVLPIETTRARILWHPLGHSQNTEKTVC